MWYAWLVTVSAAVRLNVHDLPAKTMCVNFKVIHDMQDTHQQKGNYLSGFQSTMAFPLLANAPFVSAVRRPACESHLSLDLWRASAGGQKKKMSGRFSAGGTGKGSESVARQRRRFGACCTPVLCSLAPDSNYGTSSSRGAVPQRSRGPWAAA